MAKHHIATTVNGDEVEFLCETEDTLLDVLRDTLHLTGSKEGCASGDCGACSVTLDGRLVCACLVLGCEVEGRRIETIEGLAKGETLHPLQQKFLEHAALQWASARLDFSWPPRPSSTGRPIRRRPRSATGSPAICAGAQDTTRSSPR
jgi:hypothetical protein